MKPGGYAQFWTDAKPPTLIVVKFRPPRITPRLVAKVNPPGEYVQFVYEVDARRDIN